MAVEFVNKELKKGHLRAQTYTLIRSIDSSLEYGNKALPLFISIPRLSEVIGDVLPARIVFNGYTIAKKDINPLREGKCCILSFILSPDIKRLDRGGDVVIQRDVEAMIVSRNIGRSGLQIYAAIVKPAGQIKQKDVSEAARLQNEITTSELAVKWTKQLKREVNMIDREAIEDIVFGYAHIYKLSTAQMANIINKMLRMRYGVECLPHDDEIDRIARGEMKALEREGMGSVRDEDIRLVNDKRWSPEMVKKIRNRMLSLHYNIDCDRERYEDEYEEHFEEKDEKEETDRDLILAQDILQRVEEDIEGADERDLESAARKYKVSSRVRDLMFRLKYGVTCYPESEEVTRIAKEHYKAIKLELFGEEPEPNDIYDNLYLVDPRLREQVLHKMLEIRYKIRCL
jgi:hypothetical protein